MFRFHPFVASICWFYLAMIGTIIAWTVIGVGILGLRPVTIVSGSMMPSINVGDVVLGERYVDQDLDQGMVVTFHDPDRDRLVTHRIVETMDGPAFRTRGDANPAPDPTAIGAERVVSVPKVLVPMLGRPVLWFQQRNVVSLVIWAAVTVFAVVVVSRSDEPDEAEEGGDTKEGGGNGGGGRGTLRSKHRRLATSSVGVVLVLCGASTAADASSAAAFVGATTNTDSTITAATLDSPTAVSADGKCTLALIPRVEVVWNASTGATDYHVLRSTSSDGTYSLVGTTSATTFTDTDVSSGTTYHYAIVARLGSWQSPSSTPVPTTWATLCL